MLGTALLSLGLCLPHSKTMAAEPAQAVEPAAPPASGAGEAKPAAGSEAFDALEERVRSLELAKPAQEDAIRSIIRSSLAGAGSRINEYVSLGGSLEVAFDHSSDFSGPGKSSISLSTAEADLEIKASDWITGDLVLSYDSGSSVRFPTTPSFNTGVDRFTADKAFVVIGDTQRFPLYARAGLEYLDFGSSTGVHRADVLSVANPLTVEVFEIRNPAICIGFGLPTPALKAPEPPVTVPQVRPLVVTPGVESLAHALGYQPPPSRPKRLPQFTPAPEPPAFYGSLSVYDANGTDLPNRTLGSAVNGRLGYRARGSCGRAYSDLAGSLGCPWSVDLSVDYDSSIFDSRFLQSEYHSFLADVGIVHGLAGTIKATFGPWALVGEWNGATKAASFVDDAGNAIHIRPAAWQASLAYQFDWNPWVEVIGAQGNFVSVGYSRSRDLAGVARLERSVTNRAGFVPRSRLILTAGEWVQESTKLSIEYSRDTDYPGVQGGTGGRAHSVVATITYNF